VIDIVQAEKTTRWREEYRGGTDIERDRGVGEKEGDGCVCVCSSESKNQQLRHILP
jgi:hypothetical protein